MTKKDYYLLRLFLLAFLAPFWIPLFILILLITPEEEFINDDLFTGWVE